MHKDEDSAHGMSFPDFPGYFSAADTAKDIPAMAWEAVEVHFEGEEETRLPRRNDGWAMRASGVDSGCWSTSI
jgi:predicted RNase H-like HicB family nuclease